MSSIHISRFPLQPVDNKVLTFNLTHYFYTLSYFKAPCSFNLWVRYISFRRIWKCWNVKKYCINKEHINISEYSFWVLSLFPVLFHKTRSQKTCFQTPFERMHGFDLWHIFRTVMQLPFIGITYSTFKIQVGYCVGQDGEGQYWRVW